MTLSLFAGKSSPRLVFRVSREAASPATIVVTSATASTANGRAVWSLASASKTRAAVAATRPDAGDEGGGSSVGGEAGMPCHTTKNAAVTRARGARRRAWKPSVVGSALHAGLDRLQVSPRAAERGRGLYPRDHRS